MVYPELEQYLKRVTEELINVVSKIQKLIDSLELDNYKVSEVIGYLKEIEKFDYVTSTVRDVIDMWIKYLEKKYVSSNQEKLSIVDKKDLIHDMRELMKILPHEFTNRIRKVKYIFEVTQ